MSRAWNGEALVNELSALLGDTSTVFKTRLLGWANDVIFDISSRHDWGHHLTKGKKKLTGGEETHDLEIAAPAAPEVEMVAGGELAPGSVYSVLFTYVQANGVETVAGEASADVTATDALVAIDISDIPTSDEEIVTQRKVYLKKDDGVYYYHSTIDDNFSTTLTVETEVDSEVEPPDYGSIRRLKGSPFFEGTPSRYLTYRDVDQLRLMAQGQWSSGSPQYFSPIEQSTIVTYPMPSDDLVLSFNYFRNPFKLYNSATSQPDLPIYLKPALKAGIIAYGYEYRDRDGQEMKKANYENALVDAINRGGRVANIEYSVRDVYGNTDGFEVN